MSSNTNCKILEIITQWKIDGLAEIESRESKVGEENLFSARERGDRAWKVFNSETAKYGKIWYDEDVHDLRSVETEFPAIVFNDNLTSNETLSCEPTVSSLNDNEIDFRISFDESDDEGYTVIFDKNSFSYKIISANDLKTDSENDNEKVNMPLFPSPEPSISCIDDLDFFKDFENEFLAIVYNDALTSKSDFSTEPTLCPQHIDAFDLKDETSLSEYDEVEQNVLYFNDLFPFNIIYPDDLKSDKDNDDDEINMIQPLGGNENTQGSNETLEGSHDKINKVFIMKSFVMELNVNIVDWNYLVNGMLFNLIKNLYVPFGIPFDPKRHYKDGDSTRMLRRPRQIFIRLMAPLPPRYQRHLWLRYQVEGYTEETVHDFKQRLETIFGRQVNRVHILDFEGLTPDMRQDLAERMRMVYTGDDGQEVFVSHAWRRIGDEMGLDAVGLHTAEEMVEDRFGAYWLGSERVIPDKGDLSDYWVEISPGRDFLRGAPSGQAPEKVTATDLFYLRSMVRGATNVPYLLAQYLFRHAEGRKSGARLSGGHFIGLLAHHFGLAWVAPGPERQPDAATGAPGAAEDAPAVDEGAQADPTPVQAPEPPPPAAGRTMPHRLGRLEEEMQGLRQDVRSLRGLVERPMTDQGGFSTWMISCMTQLMEASGLTYQAFDETFRGSSPAVFERHTRQRTDGASTKTGSKFSTIVREYVMEPSTLSKSREEEKLFTRV
ncbi:hypothetical protein Tco_0900836 [Tanacetum coccineum]